MCAGSSKEVLSGAAGGEGKRSHVKNASGAAAESHVVASQAVFKHRVTVYAIVCRPVCFGCAGSGMVPSVSEQREARAAAGRVTPVRVPCDQRGAAAAQRIPDGPAR